jgi:hypothetical protein
MGMAGRLNVRMARGMVDLWTANLVARLPSQPTTIGRHPHLSLRIWNPSADHHAAFASAWPIVSLLGPALLWVPILKHCHGLRTPPNRIYRLPSRNGGPASTMLAPSLLLACWLGARSVSAALQTFNLTLTAGWAAPGIPRCMDHG